MEEVSPVERVMWGMERVRSSSWAVVGVCEDIVVVAVMRWKRERCCVV